MRNATLLQWRKKSKRRCTHLFLPPVVLYFDRAILGEVHAHRATAVRLPRPLSVRRWTAAAEHANVPAQLLHQVE